MITGRIADVIVDLEAAAANRQRIEEFRKKEGQTGRTAAASHKHQPSKKQLRPQGNHRRVVEI